MAQELTEFCHVSFGGRIGCEQTNMTARAHLAHLRVQQHHGLRTAQSNRVDAGNLSILFRTRHDQLRQRDRADSHGSLLTKSASMRSAFQRLFLGLAKFKCHTIALSNSEIPLPVCITLTEAGRKGPYAPRIILGIFWIAIDFTRRL